MGCPTEAALGDSLTFSVTTHDPETAAVTDATGSPTYRVYEEVTGTAILTGALSKLDDSNTTGFYAAKIDCTVENGFEAGKSYSIYVEATVNGVDGAISFGFRVTAASTGTGARSVTITVNDGTTGLENAKVRVTQGAESHTSSTNASGVVTFSLDDATWTVAITKAGYTFTPTTLVVNETLVVNGTETQTYSMTAVVTPSSAPGQVTGYLYCYDENGAVESGVTVYLQMTAVADATGVAYDRTSRSGTSSATGLVTFTGLFTGGTYSVWRDKGRAESVTIPAAAVDPYELPSVMGNSQE